ncbi:PqqD family protein [Mariniphaga sediminis]|uniref:PqqD family protein n=1 Tax=Mariniphaga sediminis TaxID=1628158 RepID=A0A399D445_9BACT|nr:PqqD family protein [Mariniphaga sediminis]RIH66347.1 PqqD family protein [Mariniphaga sediminis]
MEIVKEVKISENGFVFNSKTGDSFNLNPTGLALIKLISEGKELDEIKKEFVSAYEVDDLTFEKDFYEFFTLLKHHQIMVQSDPLEFK